MSKTNALQGSQELAKKSDFTIVIVEKVKDLRVKQHLAMLEIDALLTEQRTREVSLAYTAMQSSRMWISKALILSGNVDYKNQSQIKTIEDVEKEHDLAKEPTALVTGANRLETLDLLRELFRNWLSELRELYGYKVNKIAYIINNSSNYLEESIMWLEAEIGRIKDVSNKDNK